MPIDSNPLKHLQSLDYSTWSGRLRRLPSTGTITEGPHGEPLRRAGNHIDIVEPSWFQTSQALTSPALPAMQVRSRHLAAAQAAAHRAGVNLMRSAFVHVRAGDYRTWPAAVAPAILSVDWYRARMAEIREARPGVTFVAIGDEPAYTDEVIAGLDDAVALHESEGVEFAAMTLCPAGILSASSFAFWGAYFAQRAYGEGTYLAPQYWAGHASGNWYPPAMRSEFLTYRE